MEVGLQDPPAETPDRSEGVFVARPLPRLRAWMSLIFLAICLLSVGGSIEFLTGSPMTEGQGVWSYFAALFAFHAIVFGGAAMIGAFPALAVKAVKAIWLIAVVLAYAVAFFVWRSFAVDALLADWLQLWAHYLPAVPAVMSGVGWGSVGEEPQPGAGASNQGGGA